MGRFSKIVRENISGPTKENGMNYGRWYLMDRDIKYVLSKLCDECDTFEEAADRFYIENTELRERMRVFDGEKVKVVFAARGSGRKRYDFIKEQMVLQETKVVKKFANYLIDKSVGGKIEVVDIAHLTVEYMKNIAGGGVNVNDGAERYKTD